ncbi:MAG: TIGR04255 family protein [bacterium]
MFNFPKVKKEPEFQYKTNFLKSVIFQFQYPENNSVTNNKELWKKALENKYPNIKAIFHSKVKFELKPDNKTSLLQQPQNTARGFEFRKKDNSIVIAFTNDSFTVTILGVAYSNFNRMFNEVKNDFFPLFKQAGISSFNRVAIRKINLFGFDQENDSNSPQIYPQSLKRYLPVQYA